MTDCPLSAEPMKVEKKQPVKEQSEEIQQPQEAEVPTTASLPAESLKRHPTASDHETDKSEELTGTLCHHRQDVLIPFLLYLLKEILLYENCNIRKDETRFIIFRNFRDSQCF